MYAINSQPVRNKKNHKTAFSLIELSIVIVIVSILITGALSASVSSVNNAKIKITNERIQTIYKALGKFLIANGRLPCPAATNASKITAAANAYGSEVGTAGTCSGTGVYTSTIATNLVYGMLPVRALGLSNEFAEDAFETKFAYVVHKGFTSSSTFGTTTATSTITVNEKTGASTTHVDTTDAIFLIISYGANKSGGYNSATSVQNARSSDSDEQSNDNGGSPYTGFDATFVASSAISDVFDDIIFYKSRNQLVADYNMLNLIPCAAGTVTINSVSYDMVTGYYKRNVIPNSPDCSGDYTNGPNRAQIKCGAFGVWGTTLALPCS